MRVRHDNRYAGLVLLSLCCALAVGLAPQRTRADVKPESTSDGSALASKLQMRIGTAALGDSVSVSVVDLQSGKLVLAHYGDIARNPASNQKLVTAAAALIDLGPAFRMRTGLYGRIEGDAVRGGLVLRGFGDPTLRSADLIALGQELAARGVRSVDEVIIDGSYFDDRILPPAFEQQPNEVAPFRAAIAAISVEENAYTLRVSPGPSEGTPARIALDGEGYFTVTNDIVTRAGAPNVIAAQSTKGDRLILRLSGSVPPGIGTLSYRRRVESPLDFAGHVLIDALRALRIQVPRRVRIAATPKTLPLLASHASAPLAQVLAALGKDSDNFVAEMIFKTLAAERVKAPGRSEDAAKHVLEVLKRRGVTTHGIAIVNGSGLFDGNLISSTQLTQLLASVYGDASIRDEYVAQLAIGGVDGTLSARFSQLPAPRVVRAKTGTLNDAIALSGYVLGPKPDQVFAFSVIANGVAGKQQAARALADQLATDLAQHLWRTAPAP